MTNNNHSSRKTRLIEKHRDINVDGNDWATPTIEDFKSKLEVDYNLIVENVYWSGFWSQGDGASFAGYCTPPTRILHAIGVTDPIITELLEQYWGRLLVGASGHYHHSGTMHLLDFDYPDVTYDTDFEELAHHCCPYERGDLRYHVWENTVRAFPFYSLESDILGFLRDLADDLYRDLEDAYDYYTSDEAVWDTIKANELDKEDDDEETDETND